MRTSPRVLIVDEDLDLLGAMEQAFAASGYQVLAAADPDEGLWLLSRRPVDLVITAVILPGREGLDVMLPKPCAMDDLLALADRQLACG